MMIFFKFIFSSGWVFFGFIFLLLVLGAIIQIIFDRSIKLINAKTEYEKVKGMNRVIRQNERK